MQVLLMVNCICLGIGQIVLEMQHLKKEMEQFILQELLHK